MTSNIGSQHIIEYDNYDEMKGAVMAELREHFRPEFLNRIDEIMVFNRLNPDELGKIIDIQLKSFDDRLAQRHITLQLSDKAKDFIAAKGYEPAFGARPLKRAIQNYLLNPLSSKLLSGEFKDGDVIKADIHKEKGSKDIKEIEFTKGYLN